MQRVLMMTVTIVFLLALLSFTVTYSVRFTEAAVVTTFGGANEGSIHTTQGLKFKLPYPIQEVTTYDTRTRILQLRSETQQTADNRLIIVEAFCTWRVSNPLRFFQSFSNAGGRPVEHYRQAQRALESNLRSAVAETSKFRMDELFSPVVGASQLPALEQRIKERLTTASPGGRSIADYGIEVVDVGINRVELPETTTTAVFDRMKQHRTRLVKELESRGEAAASTIVSSAEANAQRILAFAEARAMMIRAEGDREAAEFVAQMAEAPELAVFLSNLDFLRGALSKRTTLVFSTDTPGFGLLDFQGASAPGQIPGLGGLVDPDHVLRQLPIATSEEGGR